MATAADGFAAASLQYAHLGDVNFAAGDFRVAVANYEQALRLRPDFGEAYNNLGLAFLHVAEWARAADCLQQAVRLLPSSAPAHGNLGMALNALGKFAQAADALEQSLRLQPDNPQIAYNLGLTLHNQGQHERAVVYYRQALLLRPLYPDASNNLAMALKEQGLLDEAIAQLRETLKMQPDLALAYFNLSEFAAEGRYQFTADELARIEALRTSEHCSAAERSVCGFALAAVLNKQGRYDEAFRYYQEANDLRKRLLEERGQAFDGQKHDAMVARIMAAYDHAYFARVKNWGLDSDVPIFVVGMPRSGSTLVEQILASHPQVFGAGEVGEMREFIAQFAADAKPNPYATPLLPNARVARSLAAGYLKGIANLGKGTARITIKTLDNVLHLGVIATLFPRARVIHSRRNPLDVCLSCYFTNFHNVDFAWCLEDIAAYYRAYERLMAHWTRVLPLAIHEVRYEDLVHNQETVTRSLLAHCGLDWDERCLAFFNTRRIVRTSSTVQVRKPISAQAIGRWKHYRSHLGPLFQALGRPAEVEALPSHSHAAELKKARD